MLYTSTRDKSVLVSSAQAIAQGISVDGGLFVPTEIPAIDKAFVDSLVPLDYTKIIESVKKTGRIILASDACTRGSILNDMARNISELCFDYLDAPAVVCGAQNWITPPFEFDADFFPQADWIIDNINDKILPLKGHVSTTNTSDAEMLRKAKKGV